MLAGRLLLGAGLACAMPSGASSARGAPEHTFPVWVIGLPDGYVLLEHQARTIDVTDEDARLGTVEVPAGSRLQISTRFSGDYAIDIALGGPHFRSIRIDGAESGEPFGASCNAAAHRRVPAGRTAITLGYRISLAAGTKPGTYAWPLQVTVRAARLRDAPQADGAARLVTLSSSITR